MGSIGQEKGQTWLQKLEEQLNVDVDWMDPSTQTIGQKGAHHAGLPRGSHAVSETLSTPLLSKTLADPFTHRF